MDFGAMQCTPTNPDCVACPLVETCVALSTDSVDRLPVKEKRLTVRDRHIIYIYIRYEGQTVLHRRAPGDIWQGLYEPWLTEDVPCGAVLLRPRVKHVLTHRILYADFWLWEVEERPQLPDDYFWIKEEEVGNYGVPRLIEILLETLNT
jgi:A/G-specific adenine glycosylase